MIVVRLEGGLGNQLFQYSYGIAMQAKYGGSLLFDHRLLCDDEQKANILNEIVSRVEPNGIRNCLFIVVLRMYAALSIRIIRLIFGRNAKASSLLAELGVHHLFNSRYTKLKDRKLPFLYLHGNFMSEKFFESSKDVVRTQFNLDQVLSGAPSDILTQIRKTNSVAIHVRRGDYLSSKWRDKLHVCTDQYYENATNIINELVENPRYFIFTNNEEDIDWVKEQFKFLDDKTVFVSSELSDIEHFALMGSANHVIISNSTFSWWASYLINRKSKIVIAPSRWNSGVWDMSDIYLADWICIDPS